MNETVEDLLERMIRMVEEAERLFGNKLYEDAEKMLKSHLEKRDQNDVTRSHNIGLSRGLRAGYLDAAQYLCMELRSLIGSKHKCPAPEQRTKFEKKLVEDALSKSKEKINA